VYIMAHEGTTEYLAIPEGRGFVRIFQFHSYTRRDLHACV